MVFCWWYYGSLLVVLWQSDGFCFVGDILLELSEKEETFTKMERGDLLMVFPVAL